MGSTGLSQLFEHSVAGVTFKAFDNATGGGMSHEGGEIKEEEGTGGQVIEYRDMVVPTGNVTTSLQTADLLACIVPASLGSLPAIIKKIQHGVAALASGGRLHEDCYLKTVKISGAKGGVVGVEYAWIAKSETPNTTIASAAAKQTGKPFIWHEFNPLFDSTGLDCISWEATVDTGVFAETDCDLASSGVQRLPKEILPGPFSVAFSARIKTVRTFSFVQDYISTIGFITTATNQTGSIFTLDMTGGEKLRINDDPLELGKSGDVVLYQINGKTQTNDLSAFSATIA